MLVTVEDGRAIEVRGAPDHPPTAGTLCTKVARYLERTYSDERVLHPMRRVGRKGEGRFERISWDEALDTIAAKFGAIAGVARRPAGHRAVLVRGNDGPAAIRLDGPPLLPSPRRVAARPDDLRRGRQGGMGRDDRRRDGHRRRAIREQPADPDLGQQPDRLQPASVGARAGGEAPRREARRHRSVPQPDRGEVPRAHRAPSGHRRRARARDDARADRRGPRRSRLRRALHRRLRGAARARGAVSARARRADLRHCRRNGDAARARLRHDPAGGDPAQLRDAAPRRRRQRRARRRLPAGARRRLARSGGRRAAVVVGHLSRRPQGARAARPHPRHAAHDQHEHDRRRAARTSATPPIRAIYVYNSNPVAVAPESAKVAAGFAREDLFCVVHEIFRTDTADYADILLPATTQLEQIDVHSSYGHLYALANNPSIAPLGEAKPNTEVFRLLAARMGFAEALLSRHRRRSRAPGVPARSSAGGGHRVGQAQGGGLSAARGARRVRTVRRGRVSDALGQMRVPFRDACPGGPRSAADVHAAPRIGGQQSGAGQALSARLPVAAGAQFPQLVVREPARVRRRGKDAAARAPSRGCKAPRDLDGRSRAHLQRRAEASRRRRA